MIWFAENIGTIITLLIVMLIVFGIARSMIRNAKAGKSSCGCRCSSCPMGGACHQKNSVKLTK